MRRGACLTFVLVALGLSQGAIAATPTARVGAYYFGGWASPLDSFHFVGLLSGPFATWKPLSGWRDNTPVALNRELRYAHGAGIDFFVFDYYWGSESTTDDRWLNVPLDVYRGLPDHHGVRYAIQYTNDVERYWIPAAQWAAVVDQWAGTFFQDPDYVRLDGKPLLVIHDPDRFARSLGGADKINVAIEVLQQAARAHGLPGVFVVGDFYVGDGNPPDAGWMFRGQHFDAVSQYGYQAAAGLQDGAVPYSRLVAAGERNWNFLATSAGLPYIPDITAGWDGRPANERVDGHLWWFVRTPAEVAGFVGDAVTWSHAHPTEIVEPFASRPIVFLEAWNELQEGSYVIPTVGAGYAYAKALSGGLGVHWNPPRHALVVIVRGGPVRVTSIPRGISCARRCQARFEEDVPITLKVAAPTKVLITMRGACKGAKRACKLALTSDAIVRITVRRRG